MVISITLQLIILQVKRSTIRKGMVMVSPRLDPKACWEFESEILVLHHPTTISVRYQAMGKCDFFRVFICFGKFILSDKRFTTYFVIIKE